MVLWLRNHVTVRYRQERCFHLGHMSSLELLPKDILRLLLFRYLDPQHCYRCRYRVKLNHLAFTSSKWLNCSTYFYFIFLFIFSDKFLVHSSDSSMRICPSQFSTIRKYHLQSLFPYLKSYELEERDFLHVHIISILVLDDGFSCE